jgi:hypothetical protein
VNRWNGGALAVALHFEGPPPPTASHQRVTMDAVAGALARLKGGELAVDGTVSGGARYLVPDETLLCARAEALGIRSADDLFGGVVPAPVLRTKAVTHDLVGPDAARPAGWPDRFVASVRGVVLPGHAAFSPTDARAAAARLWRHGAVRLKPCLAAGGRGQAVVGDPAALETFLDELPADQLTAGGLVLEANLDEVRTLSVGQVRVDDLLLTYHGVQSTTTDNRGRAVYGGSDLVCVRGGWDGVEDVAPDARTRAAIAAARRYDDATRHVAGFVASRRNYDVALGRDGAGRWRLGVLEASWRAGGATPAEVAALEAFARDPGVQVVRASCVEAFGAGRRVPSGARFTFEGEDPAWGPMVRYTLLGAPSRGH